MFQAEVITGNEAKPGLNRPDNWRQKDNVGKLTMMLGPCLFQDKMKSTNSYVFNLRSKQVTVVSSIHSMKQKHF